MSLLASRARLWLLGGLALAIVAPACGDDAPVPTGPGSGGTGGAAVVAGGGAGGANSTTTGTGGSGGAPTPTAGRIATDIVNAGDTATCENYTLVHTFGQSTQNQGLMISASYRLQGGLVGANASAP